MRSVYVGCCGYCMSRSKYYSTFKTVEIQETFYDLPTENRMRLLREESPPGFVFNMKAYQGITHDLDSPTWRRARRKPSETLRGSIGLLRPTRENIELWEETVKRAKALEAKVIVVQTPPSFGFSDENLRNSLDFFSVITQRGFVVGWEPRGTWMDHPQAVKRVIESQDNLIHVVDPFRSKPVVVKEVSYFRLHGIGGRDVNYSYKYTDTDLKVLCDSLREIARDSKEIYVMFNNVSMAQDAQRFISVCAEVASQ
ncbi:MAG: DUF72 domain-containing protein [Sulfolobales archaeon]